jgi:hypothetical protein
MAIDFPNDKKLCGDSPVSGITDAFYYAQRRTLDLRYKSLYQRIINTGFLAFDTSNAIGSTLSTVVQWK